MAGIPRCQRIAPVPTIDLTVLRRDDPAAPWSDIDATRCVALADPDRLPLVVLEAGMSSGAPSIAVRLNLADGNTAIFETSLAAWIAATCAMRGAFPEAFADTPLASHG